MSRYTDIDALKRELVYRWNVSDDVDFNNKEVWQALEKALTVDIVRCKECKHRGICFGRLVQGTKVVQLNFCSYGEREGE